MSFFDTDILRPVLLVKKGKCYCGSFRILFSPLLVLYCNSSSFTHLLLLHSFHLHIASAFVSLQLGSLPHWERHTSHNKHTNLGRVTNTGAVSHCYLVKNFLITIPVCFLLFTSLLLLFVMVDCHCGLHLDLQVYLLLRIARLSHSRLIVGLNFKIFIYIVFASIASSCFVFVAFYKLV